MEVNDSRWDENPRIHTVDSELKPGPLGFEVAVLPTEPQAWKCAPNRVTSEGKVN